MSTSREKLLEEQIVEQLRMRDDLPKAVVAEIDAESLRRIERFKAAMQELPPEDANFEDPDYGL